MLIFELNWIVKSWSSFWWEGNFSFIFPFSIIDMNQYLLYSFNYIKNVVYFYTLSLYVYEVKMCRKSSNVSYLYFHSMSQRKRIWWEKELEDCIHTKFKRSKIEFEINSSRYEFKLEEFKICCQSVYTYCLVLLLVISDLDPSSTYPSFILFQ